jgi:hypothetical protein
MGDSGSRSSAPTDDARDTDRPVAADRSGRSSSADFFPPAEKGQDGVAQSAKFAQLARATRLARDKEITIG